MLTEAILDAHDYALIDPLVGDPLPPGLESVPVVPLGMENEAHLMPRLLPLRRLTTSQRSVLVHWAAGAAPTAPMLLACGLDAEPLGYHLGRKLIVKLADGRNYLLRFHDPRVFTHLRWIVDNRRMAHLLAPVSRWTWWCAGYWRRIDASANVTPHRLYPNRLQGERLARIAAINGVIDALESPDTPEAFECLARAIDADIARAQAHGWAHEPDWTSFALMCRRCHPRFDEHPRIARLIDRLARDGARFADAIAALDDADRRAIADELRARGRPDTSSNREPT